MPEFRWVSMGCLRLLTSVVVVLLDSYLLGLFESVSVSFSFRGRVVPGPSAARTGEAPLTWRCCPQGIALKTQKVVVVTFLVVLILSLPKALG